MLVDVKSRVHEPEIKELLELSVFPDPEAVERAVGEYRTNDKLSLYGYISEEEVVGVVGFQRAEERDVLLRHLAVKPEYRGAGFGRGQILELIELLKPKRVIAETDDDAVDFYRWIGFEIESIGEKYPGIERYRCTFTT